MNRFRVLQYNMQFGQIWDQTYPDRAPVRLDATLAELRRHDADIIMLQEVERAAPGGVQSPVPPNYTRLREELPGYHSWFSYPKADPRELPFGIGLAIFSRTPLRDMARTNLPSPAIEFDFFGTKLTPTDRLLIEAKTTLFGRDLQLLNTHLLAFFMLGSGRKLNPFQRNLVVQANRVRPRERLHDGDDDRFKVNLVRNQDGQRAELEVAFCACHLAASRLVVDDESGAGCVIHENQVWLT